jgi:Flp pilus assembly protein protease CpaA
MGGVQTGSAAATLALFAVLGLAALCDVRTRRVPAWLTGGGIVAGLLGAALGGPDVLRGSLLGAAAGGLIFLPFVLRGWLGGADALLLAAVGAWQGWRVALWAAWWTALAGALLALGVWAWRRRRERRAPARPAAAVAGETPAPAGTARTRGEPFPYVPAIVAGTALALLSAP